MLYFNNWCDVITDKDKSVILIKATKDDILRTIETDPNEIKQQLIDNCLSILGNNPAVCLSGGIDSQAMTNVWIESGVKFTPFTFKFAHDLNKDEVEDAIKFAEKLNLNLEIIELDVIRFLQRENLEFAKKYQLTSPQFSTHVKFLEKIKELGYSGAAMGGNGLLIEESKVRFNYSHSQLFDIDNYSKISGFPIVSNFLGFDKEFCILLAINSAKMVNLDLVTDINSFDKVQTQSTQAIRYQNKVESYQNLGFYIQPQRYKKTGFEEIKRFYNELHGSFYSFETDFRMPMHSINKLTGVESKILNEEFEKRLLKICNN